MMKQIGDRLTTIIVLIAEVCDPRFSLAMEIDGVIVAVVGIVVVAVVGVAVVIVVTVTELKVVVESVDV